MPIDYFNARDVLTTSQGDFVFYRLSRLERAGLGQMARLPFSIRIMLESVLRHCNEVRSPAGMC
jgi:aconitate hydratase